MKRGFSLRRPTISQEDSSACSVRNGGVGARSATGAKKGSSRVWAKECGTGCDGSVSVVGNERGAVQDEEARDDALGGYRTTVIAGLLRTLTIQLEGTTGAEVQSVQNCTLCKTTAACIRIDATMASATIGLPFQEYWSFISASCTTFFLGT
jgi:hypothetical protein